MIRELGCVPGPVLLWCPGPRFGAAEVPVRTLPFALALLPMLAGAPAVGAGAGGVAPATLSVEVASERLGKPSRKVVAKVRPGDQVLLRDERDTPYVIASGLRGSRTASVTAGLVATVVAVEAGGGLSFRVGLVARELTGFEKADYAPVPGGETFKVSYPRMSEAAVEEVVPAAFRDGAWRARKEIPGSGFALSVEARAISRK